MAAAQKRAARHPRSSVTLALLLLLTFGAASAQGPREPVRDARIDEVVSGEKGYGITAGPDNRLERFDVQVLAVQWDGGDGFPLVLVRTGGEFIERSGGVAAGMSGSPIYLETEGGVLLLGAIGYVFPRADHELALVTPIEIMRQARTDRLPPFVDVGGVGRAVPAAAPLLLTGVDARAAGLLAPLFGAERGTPLTVQGGRSPSGASRTTTPPEPDLVPGSALAVSLAWGDVNIQAVGTVTTVDGNDLLAFGHPFMGLGRIALPITPAWITAIVPSADVPFKLANTDSRVIGQMDQDRPGALAGRLGAVPPSIRVDLSVVGPSPAQRYSFNVPADDRIYPVVLGTGVLALLDRYLGATSAGYAEVAWEITLSSGERVNVLEQTTDPTDIAYQAAVLAFSPLAILAQNPFAESAVTQVSLAVRLDDRQRVASLEEAIAEETTVLAGENAVVHLRLQPFRQAAIVRTVSVPLPADLEGEVTLLIRGGDVPRDTGDAHLDEQEVDRPRSYAELLDALRQQVQASELVVEVVTPEGKLLRLLRTPFSYVVTGRERVVLDVTAPEPAGAPQPDAPAVEEGGGDG